MKGGILYQERYTKTLEDVNRRLWKRSWIMILRISRKVNRYHPPQVGGPYLRSQPSLSSRILSTISARTEAERQQHEKKRIARTIKATSIRRAGRRNMTDRFITDLLISPRSRQLLKFSENTLAIKDIYIRPHFSMKYLFIYIYFFLFVVFMFSLSPSIVRSHMKVLLNDTKFDILGRN